MVSERGEFLKLPAKILGACKIGYTVAITCNNSGSFQLPQEPPRSVLQGLPIPQRPLPLNNNMALPRTRKGEDFSSSSRNLGKSSNSSSSRLRPRWKEAVALRMTTGPWTPVTEDSCPKTNRLHPGYSQHQSQNHLYSLQTSTQKDNQYPFRRVIVICLDTWENIPCSYAEKKGGIWLGLGNFVDFLNANG